MAFDIRRGINIGGWLGSRGQSDVARRRAFFGRDDVIRIAGAGFDHIRLPLDEDRLWDEAGGRVAPVRSEGDRLVRARSRTDSSVVRLCGRAPCGMLQGPEGGSFR
jgi:hypothetical protein